MITEEFQIRVAFLEVETKRLAERVAGLEAQNRALREWIEVYYRDKGLAKISILGLANREGSLEWGM